MLPFFFSLLFSSLLLLPPDFSKWNYDTGLTVTLYAYSAYCPIAMLDAVSFSFSFSFLFLLLIYFSFILTSPLPQWNCSYCQRNETVKNFKTTNIFQQYGERVYVGYNPDYDLIVVAFRGLVEERWELGPFFFLTFSIFFSVPKISKIGSVTSTL